MILRQQWPRYVDVAVCSSCDVLSNQATHGAVPTVGGCCRLHPAATAHYVCAVAGVQALFDLEATNNELKADLRDLYITSAKEVDAGSRKAIIVHVSAVYWLWVI